MEEIFEDCSTSFHQYFQNTFDINMRTPEMLKCGFEKAFLQTLAKIELHAKPFIIYLHSTKNENHELFFMQNVCNDVVCDYLMQENWPIWPVDLSDDTRKSEFLSLINERLDAYESRIYQLPMLLMVTREGFRKLICTYMTSMDPMTIISQLYDQGGAFNIEKEMRIQMRNSKRDQKELQRKQKESLIQKKKEESERLEKQELEKKEKLEAENKKLIEEKKREDKIEFAKSKVINVESCPSNFTFRIRLPNGETINREFNESQTANDILYFIESLNYLRTEIKVMFSYPPKNMCDIDDVEKKLKDVGASKREVVNVQRIQ